MAAKALVARAKALVAKVPVARAKALVAKALVAKVPVARAKVPVARKATKAHVVKANAVVKVNHPAASITLES